MAANSFVQTIPVVRPVAYRVPWAATIDYLKNLIGFLQSLSVLHYELLSDGAVRVEHTPTGSWTLFRADGNVDVFAQRNLHQNAGQAVLWGCPDSFDALSLAEMQQQSEAEAKAMAAG